MMLAAAAAGCARAGGPAHAALQAATAACGPLQQWSCVGGTHQWHAGASRSAAYSTGSGAGAGGDAPGSSSSSGGASSGRDTSSGAAGGRGAPPLDKAFVAGKLSQEELWMAGLPGKLRIWGARARPELKGREAEVVDEVREGGGMWGRGKGCESGGHVRRMCAWTGWEVAGECRGWDARAHADVGLAAGCPATAGGAGAAPPCPARASVRSLCVALRGARPPLPPHPHTHAGRIAPRAPARCAPSFTAC